MLAFVLLAYLTVPVRAENEMVRFGTYYKDYAGDQPQNFGMVSNFVDRLQMRMQLFQENFDNCPQIIAGPIGKANPRDQTRFTWINVQSIRVQCWAWSHFYPWQKVTVTKPQDRLTPQMIYEVIAGIKKIGRENTELGRVLFTFSGGAVTCKEKEICVLTSPPHGEWANYSIYLELLIVHNDNWFIEVSQEYKNRVGFIYGVHFRKSESVGEVITVFPDFTKFL